MKYIRNEAMNLKLKFPQAETQIRAERDADLKNLRRSVSPKRPKSPSSKSPRSRSTSPIPLRYPSYSATSAATPYEEYRSAISSLRNLRDNPTYLRTTSPPAKGGADDINLSSGKLGGFLFEKFLYVQFWFNFFDKLV